MRRVQTAVVALYTHLLRLYPAGFRAEFGEEMADVFRLKLDGADTNFGRLSLLLSEVRDLPLSVIRERLREGQVIRQEQVIIVFANPNRVFQFCTLILIGTLAAQAVFVLLPSLLVYLAPEMRISVNGDYLPTVPQSISLVLWAAASVTLIFGPIWMSVTAGYLALTLRKYWTAFSAKQHLLGGTTIVLFCGLMILLASPIGKSILYVFWD